MTNVTVLLAREPETSGGSRRPITRTLAAFAAAAIVLAGSCGAGAATDGLPAGLDARVDAAIDRAISERRIVGTVVMVLQDGIVAYRRAAGHADREAARPMREDAIFRLGSLSKTVVSVAALALVDRGRLNLDDPVTRWLPGFQPRTQDGEVPVITVRHLLTHTAGLSYSFLQPPDGPYDRAGVSDGLDRSGIGLDEEVRRIASAGLAYEPGTRWARPCSRNRGGPS